jgi:hypothetical protein
LPWDLLPKDPSAEFPRELRTVLEYATGYGLVSVLLVAWGWWAERNQSGPNAQ